MIDTNDCYFDHLKNTKIRQWGEEIKQGELDVFCTALQGAGSVLKRIPDGTLIQDSTAVPPQVKSILIN